MRLAERVLNPKKTSKRKSVIITKIKLGGHYWYEAIRLGETNEMLDAVLVGYHSKEELYKDATIQGYIVYGYLCNACD